MLDGDNSELGVNLIAYIRAEMGLGTAARGLASALEAAKIPFNILNFEHSNPGLHRDTSWRHKEVDRSTYDFTVLAINPDNLANAKIRAQDKFVRDRYTIGYWFWELPDIPQSWIESFSLVDEIWTGSRFVQDAISVKSPVPVFRLPVAVRVNPPDTFSRRDFGLPGEAFLFLSMADAHSELARKNPLGAIRAFKKAFPTNARNVGLVIKISNSKTIHTDDKMMALIRKQIRGRRNIYLLDRDMTRAEIAGLLAMTDCFVSLHRSEGFGLGPAEAMSLGKPAILTNWSGNTDYMTSENSIGIDYELVRIGKQYGPYPPDQYWADPDLKQAASWMKRLVQQPNLARRIGKAGQETIRGQFSPEAIGKMVHARLSSLKEQQDALMRRGGTPKTAIVQLSSKAEPVLTVYFADEEGYNENRTVTMSWPAQRWWHCHITLEHGLGAGRLRIDPLKMRGVIDIGGLAIKSSTDGRYLWKATARAGLDVIRAGGTAIRIPTSRGARIISYGEDPQIYLPLLAGPKFQKSLRLELWLRADNNSDATGAVLSDLVSAVSRAADETALLQRKNTSNEEAVAALDVQLIKSREHATMIGEQLALRNSELEQARSTLDERAIRIEQLTAQVLKTEGEKSSVEEQLKQREAEIALSKGDLLRITDQRDRTAAELVQNQILLDDRAREFDQVQGELIASTRELMDMAAELSEVKQQFLEYKKKRDREERQKPSRLSRALFASRPKKDVTEMPTVEVTKPAPTFWIEHPNGPSIEGALISISGWALSRTRGRIEGIRALVNGQTFPGSHGFERKDVAAQENNYEAAWSGFTIEVGLATGTHHIALERRSKGRWEKFCSFRHEVHPRPKGRGRDSEKR